MSIDIDLRAVAELFSEESAEGLVAMEESLVRLESQPRDGESVSTLFRVTHTIKGNAASLGFPGVAELAHVLEDILDDLRERRRQIDASLVSLLLEGVDAMREAIRAALAGEQELSPGQRALLGRLRLVAGQASAPGALESEPAPGAGGGRRDEDHDRTLRVAMAKLDRMLTLTGEIAIAQGRLRQLLGQSAAADGDAVEAHAEAERLCLDLQELVMKARMVPLGPVFRQLVVEGEGVEVDTAVAEHIRDPITHMIRNALDHGIETPQVREQAGKDPCGRVTLRARHSAGSIVIEIEDDGAGLDRRRIAERARARGLVADPEALSEAELCRLVFEPGFSTSETVTELSGRGIGLDVVRRSIEALRGSVGIESREGHGTLITLRFPLTLAIIGGLKVDVAGETLIIPLDGVVECLELPPDCSREVAGRGVVNVRGEALPYVRLRQLFELVGPPPARELVVVVRHGRERAGLAVDGVLGESQNVIKPLGKLFGRLAGIAGSTILGSGRVALILDLPTLLRLAS
jgi:two-component system chemotaxis sensor kinase CheA